jgi:Ca-activated chloride channel family protein
MQKRSLPVAFALVIGLTIAACGDGSATTTTGAAGGTTSPPAETTSTTRSSDEVTITPAAEIAAGTEFTVAWTGPNNEGDYITIVEVGADEGAYQSFFYTYTGPEGTLTAPTAPGEYEIRYIDGATEATVLSVTVTVLESPVTLDSPEEVEAGTEFDVSWTGPNGPGDYVTIVPADADEGVYESYFYTSVGAEGVLVAPVEDGAHEIRYISGVDNTTLYSVPITVVPFTVTLDAPDSVDAGADFEVAWTGPEGPGDYITIVEAGAPVGSYLDWAYITEGSPLTLTAPDDSGDYEVRYVTDRGGSFTFASIPIEVN